MNDHTAVEITVTDTGIGIENKIKPSKSNIPIKSGHSRKIANPEQLNFLIVEDDEINRIVISAYLKHPKIKLSIAKTGLEAVEICRKQQFDMIFMDVSMPVMGGVEKNG